MATENGPFEDVFPIENGIFHCYVSLPKGISFVGQYPKPTPSPSQQGQHPGRKKGPQLFHITAFKFSDPVYPTRWVFPKIGETPQNGWSIMEDPIKMDETAVAG